MYEFDYQLKQTDFMKFQLVHSLTDKRTHILYILIALGLSLLTVNPFLSPVKYLISFFIIYFLMLLACLMLIIPFTLLKKDFVVLSKTHLIFEQTRFFSQSKYGESKLFWHNKIRIKDRLGNVMLYVSPNMALLIPKRAFKSDQQRHEFIEFCKKNIKNSALA